MIDPDPLSNVTEGDEYGFRCTVDGNGEIYNRESRMLWRFRTLHRNGRGTFFSSFFQPLADCLFYDNSDLELLTIRCERRYPLSRFVMFESGLPVCTIQQRSLLQTKYIIEFTGGIKWTLQLPLFTVFYKVISETGSEVLIRLVRHDTWYLKVFSQSDNFRLLAALAFIHRERQ